jgi:Fic-DOC domain mobile mystery protein B
VTLDIFAAGESNTPLTPDEQNDLIPELSTKQELNEWERQNIIAARVWAFEARGFRRRDPLTESYVRELHRRMFDESWKWAGLYRATERNLGVPHYQIREMVAALLGDVRYWIAAGTYAADEIGVRFHHRLVSIHPFANGNGRHTRLIADVLMTTLRQPEFTWGSEEIVAEGEIRRRYIAALKAADRNDIGPLLAFARS